MHAPHVPHITRDSADLEGIANARAEDLPACPAFYALQHVSSENPLRTNPMRTGEVSSQDSRLERRRLGALEPGSGLMRHRKIEALFPTAPSGEGTLLGILRTVETAPIAADTALIIASQLKLNKVGEFEDGFSSIGSGDRNKETRLLSRVYTFWT